MYIVLACLLATVAAAPATYDQSQNGEKNIHTDIKHVIVVLAYPKEISSSFGFKSNKPFKRTPEIQERADIHTMKSFEEPNTPYKVEIGSKELGGGNGRDVEVLIAGRHHIDPDAIDRLKREIKLLGSTTQCGPDRERDPDTLMCRARSQPESTSEEKEVEKEKNVVTDPSPEVVAS